MKLDQAEIIDMDPFNGYSILTMEAFTVKRGLFDW